MASSSLQMVLADEVGGRMSMYWAVTPERQRIWENIRRVRRAIWLQG